MNGSRRADRVVPLDRRLRAISDSIPASCIDELWVFPPLPNRDIGSEFIVLLCYDGGEDRRRILTAHVDAQRSDPEGEEVKWVQRLREHGTAPHRWAAEIPDRMLQRLAEAGTPEVFEVGGRVQSWEEAIERFAAAAGGVANGNGSGSGSPLILVDSGAMREISFTTVIEASLPARDGGEDNSESDV